MNTSHVAETPDFNGQILQAIDRCLQQRQGRHGPLQFIWKSAVAAMAGRLLRNTKVMFFFHRHASGKDKLGRRHAFRGSSWLQAEARVGIAEASAPKQE